jgi:SET domain-containing protein
MNKRLILPTLKFMELNLFIVLPLMLFACVGAGIGAGMLLSKKQPGTVAIRASTVSGRGAFSLKKIGEGDIIERCPALEVTDKDIGGELLNYVFYGSTESARLVAMGNGMLFNHSSTPNVAYYREQTALGPELVLYALRNIRKGEELFYSYGEEWWSTRQ